MEDEVRDILCHALSAEGRRQSSLVEPIRARVEPLGCIDQELAPRGLIRTPPDLDA